MADADIEDLARELYERNPATKAMYPPIPIPWDQASDIWKDAFRSEARKRIEHA